MEIITGAEWMMTDKMMSTKERILEISINLFSRHGYSAVSIRDITREVGIKESTLYYHFKNKEEILNSIFTMYQQGYANIFPSGEKMDSIIRSVPPAAFLMQGIVNYKKHIADHPVMSKISRIIQIEQFGHQRARDIMIHDMIETSIDFVELVFSKMMEAGLIRSFPPRLLACEYQYPVFAMFMEYQLLQFDGKPTAELEKRLEEHVVFFIDRIQN